MLDNDATTSTKQNECPAIENPLTTLTRLLHIQLEICDDLERVADSLPQAIEPQRCRKLANLLRTFILPVHEIEERIVLPSLLSGTVSSGISIQTLERLRGEHGMDRGYAGEIAELLHQVSDANCSADMNTVGYALRGFFESVRRHVHFDLEQIIPLARRRMGADEIKRMSELLQPYLTIVAYSCLQTRSSIMSQQPCSIWRGQGS